MTAPPCCRYNGTGILAGSLPHRGLVAGAARDTSRSFRRGTRVVAPARPEEDRMRWILDRTGRYRWRPYYTREEIERRCEARVHRFLRTQRGAVRFPISTDDLMVLIEQDVDDLDVCADLSHLDHDGMEVEGVTTFIR